MIRWIRIFIWLRVRTLINTAKSGARRDAISQLSRFAEAAAPILLAVFLIPLSLGLAVAALAGGWWMASNPDIQKATVIVRILLGVALGLVLISPMVSAMKGESSNSVRLLLLPIPRHLLHAVQVISGIGDPAIAGLIPALLALPVGLALGGSPRSALLVGGASLLFLVVLLAVQSLAASLMQMLYRDRRRAEWISMALVASLIALGLLSGFIDEDRSGVTIRAPQTPLVRVLMGALPSEMYGGVLKHSLQAANLPAMGWLAGLTLTGAALLALNWILFRRLLDTPESSGSKGSASRQVRSFLLPGLGRGASAVAWVTLRNVMRTGRGRLSIFLTPLMVPILGLAILSGRQSSEALAQLPIGAGLILALMAVAFSLMTNQPAMLNQFGADRSGLSLLFLSPLSGRELVLGKLAAIGLMVAATALGGMAGALLVAPSGHPALWLACLLLILSSYLLEGPLGTILSVLFPKASNLSQWSSEGNPHPAAALLGTFLLGPVLGPPVALAAIGLLLLKSLLWVWILLLAWCALCAAISWGLIGVAGRMLDSRREALAMVAQGK